MSQGKFFSFGVDHIAFIDQDFNVFAIDDPQNATMNFTSELTQHRGGANNDVRASALHTRSGELTIGTGYVDATLAQLLTGGTITSATTSASSVTTGTASGANSLFGGTDTVQSGISTITINSPTLVKSTDYYLRATGFDEITVTRVEDGKQFAAVTLTNSADDLTLDSERGIVMSTTASATSLTVDEKGIVIVRQAINTINNTWDLDPTKPSNLSIEVTVDFDGIRRTFKIPKVQPSGTIQGNSATEFQVQDITMQIENDATLDRMARIVQHG